VALRCFVVFTMSLSASKAVHGAMVNKVLAAPISSFFDVTPTGLIMNRFSKDLQVLDNKVIFTVGGLLVSSYMFIAVLVVAVIANPTIIPCLPFMLKGYWTLFQHSIPAYRESAKIEAQTKSPMLSLLEESFAGSSSIRAFKRTDLFQEKFEVLLSHNLAANKAQAGSWCWYGVRMDSLATAFSVVACLLSLNSSVDPILRSVLLAYLL